MSAVKYAPWRAETKRGLGEIVVGASGQHIATVYLGSQAALMAAAPELLVELQQLAETAHNHFTVPDSVWAAIAKATGGAS